MPDPRCPHCQTSISKHPAGRCLDAWVAERVMGWKVEQRSHGWVRVFGTEKHAILLAFDWHPSEDIAAAWEALTKLECQWAIISLMPFDNVLSKWTCNLALVNGYARLAIADAAPLAICRAGIMTTTKENSSEHTG